MSLGDQLNDILLDLLAIRVESALILGAILLLISGLFNKSQFLARIVYLSTVVVAAYFQWIGTSIGETLSGGLMLSEVTQNFSFLFLMVALVIPIFQVEKKHSNEFFFFILSILIGSILLMKSNSLLIIYMAVELTSFGSYIITNFSFNRKSNEAGIKYLLFGAISSAIMLLGLSLLYGSTGTLAISSWSNEMFYSSLSQTGLVLTIGGLFFKASIVPFQIWVPSTYQSAPSAAVAFMSIVPKISAIILMGGIFSAVSIAQLPLIKTIWLCLGMVTILVGTFSAIRESSARRMISYGAIAHSGFLFPFIIIGSDTAILGLWWYSIAYAIVNLGVFYLLDFFERNGVNKLNQYEGLGQQESLTIVCFTLLLISLVGLPPLAGFTAKFFLFSTLWDSGTSSGNSIYLVYLAVAVLSTVVSLFFYLRIPYYSFLVKSTTSQSIVSSLRTKFVATLFAIVLLLLFFVPQIVIVMQQLLNTTVNE